MVTKTLGVFENVDFPEYGIYGVKAKIDTGAYTGAFHCTNIQEAETPNGKILRFSPFDKPDLVKTATDFVIKNVTSSNGANEQRYFIQTKIVLDGIEYSIILSLADRSTMKWPVLVGRKFLRMHDLLVDVKKKKK
jgi:hypothetical protein